MNTDETVAQKDTAETVHPSGDRLVAFAEGLLEENLYLSVERHLEDCGECRELVDDLRAYPALEPPSEDHRVSADETLEALNTVRRRIEDISEEPAPVHTLPGATLATTDLEVATPANWFLLAAAVVITLGASALSWHLASTQARLATQDSIAELESARHPRGGPDQRTLFDRTNTLRSPSGQPMEINPRAGDVLLTLDTAPQIWSGTGTVEIRDANQRLVYRLVDLGGEADGIQLLIPKGSLSAGSYVLTLVRNVPVADAKNSWSYDLRVVP